MAHSFYAVKRGFDKKQNCEVHDLIFTDWLDVKPLVNKYENARYKGFDTEEEAKTWLEVVDKKDAERRSKDQIENLKKDIGISYNSNDLTLNINKEDIIALKNKGYSESDVFFALTKSLMYQISNVYNN